MFLSLLLLSIPLVSATSIQTEETHSDDFGLTGISKIVSIFGIFALTYFSGLLPLVTEMRNDVIRYANVLSGGTLITTAMLHMIPEANLGFYAAGVGLPSQVFPIAECIALVGFIITLLIDSGHSHHEQEHDIESHAKMSKTERIIFIVSISAHGIFEGLIIGNAPSWEEVFELSLILSFHKIFAAISLTIYLLSKNEDPEDIKNDLILYSAKMPLGVALATTLYHTATDFKGQLVTAAVCNSITGGSLLYSSISNIIIPSFKHDDDHSSFQHKEYFPVMLGSFVTGCGIMLGMLFLHHSA
jgi:zinc transporter ZupT